MKLKNYVLHYTIHIYIFYIVTGMHRRGKLATAPVSEAATREGRRCLRIEPRPVFFFVVSRYAPTWADSRRFGPNRIVSAEYRCVSAGKRKSAGEGKKKKKQLKPKIPRRYCRHNFTGLNPFFLSLSSLLLHLLLPFFRRNSAVLFCFFLLISFVFFFLFFWKG